MREEILEKGGQALKVEKIKISSLKEYQNNAKIHTKEQIQQIVKSIEKFGFNDPIAIDEHNMIIEGHGRFYAVEEMGWEEVPCIRLNHLSDQEKKAYILAHNKLTMNTGFDEDILNIELLNLDEIDMSQFGFDVLDLESDFSDNKEKEEDLEKVLDEINYEEPTAEYGAIYKLGNHRLMCGDSTDKGMVEKLVGDKSIDLLVTDPPYNVDYESKEKQLSKYSSNNRVSSGKNTRIDNDNMSSSEFLEFLSKAFNNAEMHLKSGGVFYIWHATSEVVNFLTALQSADLEMREILVWVKNHFVLGRQDYHWQHEPCIYGWKSGAAHNWYGDRKQTTVLEFDKPMRNADHPTMKPVDLISYLLKNSSKENDVVLDLFGGSGTTLIACEENNRICYMMEYNPVYVDTIIRRWENLTGKKAVKIS